MESAISGQDAGRISRVKEAHRGRSKNEFIAKCGDSLREAEETAYWLELLITAGIGPVDKLDTLRQEADELIAIFVAIIKRAKGV